MPIKQLISCKHCGRTNPATNKKCKKCNVKLEGDKKPKMEWFK